MKVLIPTIGTRGDLQPYIALALGLQAKGHVPTLASHPFMRSLVESYELNFAPIGPDIDIGRETAIIRGKSRNWMSGFMRVMKFSFNMLEQSHADLLALAKETDQIIVSHTAAGSIEADMLDLPFISVTLMPQAIPVENPKDSLFKKGVGKIAGAGMGLIMTRPLNKIRARLGMKPVGDTGISSPALNLIPISPYVDPPNPLWESRHCMTGYWFAPSPASWAVPQNLMHYLETGEAPIVISLGAMAISGNDAMQAAQITLEAIRHAKIRAIIQGWNEALQDLTLPASVFHAGALPHEWLLPRCKAFVHHGGFGSTAAGFRAGIPGLAIPHIIDQFIWGQKINELGVGPKPIPRTRLTVEALTEALNQLAHNPQMVSTAADLGKSIRAENGVETAVERIEKQWSSWMN